MQGQYGPAYSPGNVRAVSVFVPIPSHLLMFSMRRDIWPSCAVSLRPPGRARWCRGSAIASRLLAPLEPRLHVIRIEPENVARQPEPRDLAGAPAAQDCLGRHAQELRNLAGRQEAVSHPDSAKRDQSAAPTIPA